MMYKTDHHRVDVKKDKYLQSGDNRIRGDRKFYQKTTTCEAYRNSFFPTVHSFKDVFNCTTEPRHDKTNKMIVRPAKTQISLGIRPV